MNETKTVTITNPADWREGDTAERVWPDGTTLRGVLRRPGSLLYIGASMHIRAKYPDGTFPDGSTVTVTREVPGRVLPTALGSVILAAKVRGVTLDPPVVAALYDGGGWITATLGAETQYVDAKHIEEWAPATVLPTEVVLAAIDALGVVVRDWPMLPAISGDDLRTIRDALKGVTE